MTDNIASFYRHSAIDGLALKIAEQVASADGVYAVGAGAERVRNGCCIIECEYPTALDAVNESMRMSARMVMARDGRYYGVRPVTVREALDRGFMSMVIRCDTMKNAIK